MSSARTMTTFGRCISLPTLLAPATRGRPGSLAVPTHAFHDAYVIGRRWIDLKVPVLGLGRANSVHVNIEEGDVADLVLRIDSCHHAGPREGRVGCNVAEDEIGDLAEPERRVVPLGVLEDDVKEPPVGVFHPDVLEQVPLHVPGRRVAGTEDRLG